MYKNLGFIPEVPKDEDYELGSLQGEILRPDGQWDNFLPVIEVQRKQFESYSCVSFAGCNVAETIHKLRYGTDVNYSDRFLAKVSGTNPNGGNSLSTVQEAARKNGFVPEEQYPFTDAMSKTEYWQTIPKEILDLGIKWTTEYEYGYEWANKSKWTPESAIEALKYSPLHTAVDANTNRTANFNSYNHSIMVYGFGNSKWKVFDSYLNRWIEYDWDYPFHTAIRVHYKQIITLNIDDMPFRLVKGDRPEVYFVDLADTKHHVDSPATLTDIFSNKAWDAIVKLSQVQIDSMPTGKPISVKGLNFLEAVKQLIQTLGRKGKAK